MNNLRVALDLNPVLRNRYSGFYSYGLGLLDGFSQLKQKPEITLFYSKQFSQIADAIHEQLDGCSKSKETLVKKRWLEKLWRVSSFPSLQSFTGQFDIYHCLHHMMPPTKGKPSILTLYDMRRYKIPEMYRGSKLDSFEIAVKKADHFIAISQATKDDFCDIFNVRTEKVDVVHLAVGTEFGPIKPEKKATAKANISKMINTELDKYLLVFSSPDQRKNIGRTIQAFLSASDKIADDIKLVVLGMLPKNDELYDQLISEGKLDRVVITGPVEDISDLLRCAEGLVFASFYEGFGIPILEAFACNVPLITSNCSSMPEVAGDGAIYVDPERTESISEAIVQICTDTDRRNALVTAGKKRSLDFSWKKTAGKTFEIYEKLA
jgi:glycosyltransferase involved in cell wall biosynthesis